MMKRLTGLILTFLFFFVAFFAHAETSIQGEKITNFSSSVVVNKDGTINVTETIVYDFDVFERHGIYRDFPNVKRDGQGKRFELKFDQFRVTDPAGGDYSFSESRLDGGIRLKIGDPDITITGIHTYIISYRVSGAIGYFADQDEIYWNVTGNGWNIPIIAASAKVTLPAGVNEADIKTACYTGTSGGLAKDCEIKPGEMIEFSGNSYFPPAEGLTIVVGFPKNTVAVLLPQEIIPFQNTLIGKLTIIAIILLALWWYLIYPVVIAVKWFTNGRDPKGTIGVVTAGFDAPELSNGRTLTPAETGALIDERADMKDISAMIVNLAQRGYFDIVEKKKKDFYLEKKKEFIGDADLLPFEKEFLTSVFDLGESVRIKDQELYETVARINSKLYDQLVVDKLFPKNPNSVRNFYLAVAIMSFITGNVFGILSALIFGLQMPRKTEAGVNAANLAKSLRNFLSSQDRQLNFQAKNQMMFEKLLPYAVAFGVEKEWANRFQDFKLKSPDWYQGYYAGSYFNSVAMSNSLSSSFASTLSASSTPPSTSSSGFSSGGGFSGGGGGGGGGGSW